jgi:hypothetical protein
MKWCITWEDADYFVEVFKEKEKQAAERGTKLFMDSHALAYALRSLFKHKGFWMKEENDG